MKALSFLTGPGSARRANKRRFGLSLAAGLAIVLTAAPGLAQSSSDTAAQARVEAAFDALETAGFRGVAAVSLAGEPVFMRGAGLADAATERRFGPDTQIDILSITKTYTGMLAAQMIVDGQLSADTRLDEVFDNVPADKAGITLHHLLTHASGLPAIVGSDVSEDDLETVMARAFAEPLSFEPGTAYDYSNVGYSLAAAMIEQAAGAPYETVLLRRLDRIGVSDTGYDAVYDAERAVHLDDGRDLATVSWGGHPPNWNLMGNGGLVSTASDMLAWRHAYASGDLVSAQARDLAHTPFQDEGGGVSYYGYGLVVEDHDTLGRIYWHNGGNRYFSAHWRDLDDHGLVLFAASDRGPLNADRVAAILTAAWFDRPYEIPTP